MRSIPRVGALFQLDLTEHFCQKPTSSRSALAVAYVAERRQGSLSEINPLLPIADMLYTCTICDNLIAADEAWQYAEGAYPSGMPESERTRVHRACFSVLLRRAIELLAAVPPEEWGDDEEPPTHANSRNL